MDDGKTPADAHSAGAPNHEHEPIPGDDFTEHPRTPPPQFAESMQNFGDTYLTPEEEQRRRLRHEAAVTYWTWGFRTVPLRWTGEDGSCSCGRQGCPSPGKHPVDDDWQNPPPSADNDAGWWRMPAAGDSSPSDWLPRANIGILTGEPSGIFVIDIDPENGGDVRWEQLCAEHQDDPLPGTLITRTGSGGRHYYFRYPGWHVGNTKPWGRDAGIDVRGDGGQVVAPPSVSGKGPYEVIEPVQGAGQIAPAPAWILDAIREDRLRQYGESVGNPNVLPSPLINAYVREALRGNAAAVREAPKGDRNNSLNKAAWRLGQFGAHGLISEDEAWTALQDAAIAAGLDYGETRQTFSSGWRSGLNEPADLSSIGGLADHEWPIFPQDEFGLGDRLVHYRGTDMRWVEEWGTWMICANGCWHRRSDAEAERMAQDVIRLLAVTEEPQYLDEIEEGQKESPQDRFRAWRIKMRTHAKVAAMVKIARDRPPIRAAAGDFDSRPMLLSVANGIVDLTTGHLRAHDPGMMITIQSPTTYDPDLLADPLSAAPLWRAYLERVQPDPAVRQFLQMVMGYSVTGSTAEQMMFLHLGPSSNGKSVFHEVASHVLGPYSQATPVETLTAKRTDGKVPNDVARMKGKRYLVASEAREGKELDWALLKQLIAGDIVAARFMRAEFFEFRPTGKIHLTANHMPPTDSHDPAIWRRLRIIPWTVVIPPEERDGELPDKLKREAMGILAWIIQGAVQWWQGPPGYVTGTRLVSPTAVKALEQEQRNEQDVITPAIDACLSRVDPPVSRCHVGHKVPEIYEACKFFWDHTGSEPPTKNKLTRELQKMGFHLAPGKSDGVRWFTDLRVAPPPSGSIAG